ncbi:MAG: fucose isomerase, partial [Pyrobaculum sp.]
MAYLFVSKTRGEEYVNWLRQFIQQQVGLYGGERPPKVPLIVHGSGGTTWDVVSFIKESGAAGAVLVGFGEHNSYAAALHTKAELETEGVPAVVYHCPTLSECVEVLKKAKAVADAASSMFYKKALLIGRHTPQVEAARERFHWDVEVMPLEKFEEFVAASGEDPEAKSLSGSVQLAKLTEALRRLAHGRDLVAIQCFPYLMRNKVTPCLAVALLNRESIIVCEGDLSAAFAMALSKKLSKYSGWVANVVYRRGAQAAFAHCTISLDMVKSWALMPHFESGYPVGVAGELAHDVYTIVSASPRLDKLAVGRAKVLKSGNFIKDACRTQALVEFEKEVDLEKIAPANHHVFIPGDYVEEIESIAKLL